MTGFRGSEPIDCITGLVCCYYLACGTEKTVTIYFVSWHFHAADYDSGTGVPGYRLDSG